MVRFALNTYGHFTANYVTRNLDNLLVGWFFGSRPLGLYKRAYDLTVLPIGQLSNPLQAVAVPTLSRLSHDSERFKRFVLRSLSTVAFVGVAAGAGFGIVGRDLFVLLFGQRWEESGRLFTFFAPGMASMMIYLTYSYIHVSIGRPERLLRWGLVELAVTASLFVLGVHWGTAGIAVAWSASSWILLIPALWYAGQPVGLTMSSMAGSIWRYVIAGAVAASLAVLGIRAVPAIALATGWSAALGRSALELSMFCALYLAAVVGLYRGLNPIREFLSLLAEAIPRTVSRASAAGIV
jgi:PST family polysaccharide transporter